MVSYNGPVQSKIYKNHSVRYILPNGVPVFVVCFDISPIHEFVSRATESPSFLGGRVHPDSESSLAELVKNESSKNSLSLHIATKDGGSLYTWLEKSFPRVDNHYLLLMLNLINENGIYASAIATAVSDEIEYHSAYKGVFVSGQPRVILSEGDKGHSFSTQTPTELRQWVRSNFGRYIEKSRIPHEGHIIKPAEGISSILSQPF